ncbi:unnamed protein product [Amoebophrya sp. A25]|nr:unnamed protein product [Amoebophrya sp. A25]|eukprot:GSA25T00004489001.1
MCFIATLHHLKVLNRRITSPSLLCLRLLYLLDNIAARGTAIVNSLLSSKEYPCGISSTSRPHKMMYSRRGLSLLVLLALLLVTYAATNSAYWIQWAVFLIFMAMLYICDLIFLGDGAFDFDPFYASYAKKTEPTYFTQKIG